jgi:hypothetical protein
MRLYPTPLCFLPCFLLAVVSANAFAKAAPIQDWAATVPVVVASLGLPADSGTPPSKPDSAKVASQTTKILSSSAPTLDLRWDEGVLVVRSRSAEPVQVEVLAISGRRLATMRQSVAGGEVRFRLEGILNEETHVLCLRQGAWSCRWTQAGSPATGNIGSGAMRNAD